MNEFPRPSLQDSIVAFLREQAAGVSSGELAGRFLKLKSSSAMGVAIAVKAMLMLDRRCFQDEAGLWHAHAGGSTSGSLLGELPLVATYALIDPVSLRVWHLSLWKITPAVSCCASGWLVNPAMLSFDDRDRLMSRLDPSFTPEAAREILRSLAPREEVCIPVFLGSMHRSRLAYACSAIGESFPDDTMVVSDLLRAAGAQVSRPLTLAALSEAVPGAGRAPGESAMRQGERFALVVAELVSLLGRKGIETRDDLDALFCKEKAPLFAGKEFSYDDLLALPATPGVYAFKDMHDRYLYIGKAKNLKRRILNYFCETDESPRKLERLRGLSCRLVTHRCGSELESLVSEYRLIRKYSPPLNRKTEVVEDSGTFRTINDCIVLLPHSTPGKGMSVWVRQEQKILLKSLDSLPDAPGPILGELDSFFFSGKLRPESSDFPEHQIVTRWLRRHGDEVEIVPVHRMASAEQVYDALRTSWRKFCDNSRCLTRIIFRRGNPGMAARYMFFSVKSRARNTI